MYVKSKAFQLEGTNHQHLGNQQNKIIITNKIILEIPCNEV